MDEGSESRFRSLFKSLFGKNGGHDLEEHILEAREEGEIESDEVSMLLNVLELDSKTVSEIMVPRTDMECAADTASIREVASVIINQGAHSRIPIYKDTKDTIVGIVHSKDLLAHLVTGEHEEKISTIMRPAVFVPENMTLDLVLGVFRKRKVHMAIIQDEYGGTSGLVTLEDVLEEIVGDIDDEYDAGRPDEIRKQDDGSWLLSGRLLLDEMQEKCGIELDSEHVDSLGGYIASEAGHIPVPGEKYVFAGYEFTVLEADDRQVWLVHAKPAPDSEQ